jgi:hypothetical protein
VSACRRLLEQWPVVVGEQNAESERVGEVHERQLVGERERLQGVAAVERPVELAVEGGLRRHERMFARLADAPVTLADTMDPVAVAAVAGAVPSAAVGITAIIAGEYRSGRERAATLALADAQHQHDRTMRRGERFFEKRGHVYESLLTMLYLAVERFALTEPMLTFEGQPEPPEPPSDDEWRTMQVRLAAYGSPEVADAFDRFVSKGHGFNAAVVTLRITRDQGGSVAGGHKEVHEARQVAGAVVEEIKRLVRADLAEL